VTFAQPQLLWLLLAPAALLVATLLPARSAAALAHPKIARARLSASSFQLLSATKNVLGARLFLLPLALAALVLALARPQGRTLATPTITESRDVLVAVDVSRSMLADDLPPNRLTRARLLVRTLADELKGERLGLLPFAGTAFLQCPLSADYDIFRTFLEELGPDLIPAGGSDFAGLLTAADEAFGPATGSSPDAPATADRYLIILSDGEAQDDTWKPLAQKLVARGVRVIALGLGTSAGAMVPDGKGGLVKDARGAAVLSRLDASTLQELARLSDGAYRDASAWIDLPALLKETVSRGRTARTTTDTAPRREELFTWFRTPALALLAAALLREFPVTPRARQLRPPALPVAALLLGLFFLPSSPPPARAADAPPPADPLVSLVGQLASAPDLAAPDLARLATVTADQGEKASPQSPAPPKGALQDALAAVNQGAALDPSAADWKALRSRLDALLNPPKPPRQDSKSDPSKDPQKSDQNKSSSDQNQSSDQKSNDPKKSDPKDSSGSPDQKSSTNPDNKDASSSPSSSSSEPSSSGPGEPKDPKAPASPPPADSKALGDLSNKSDPAKPTPAPSSDDGKTPPETPEPTQRAGGVSTSGQPSEAASVSAAATSADPALAAPRQRLDRVRSADAPARLYQLMQEAETPPDAESRAAARKRDW
jgi:Ca-activated chloride channel family protein